MRWGIALVQLMGKGVVSGGLRMAWSEVHELRLALEGYKIKAPEATLDARVISAAINLAQTRLTGDSD